MLKNHRNRASVFRFESKFIYLTCRRIFEKKFFFEKKGEPLNWASQGENGVVANAERVKPRL